MSLVEQNKVFYSGDIMRYSKYGESRYIKEVSENRVDPPLLENLVKTGFLSKNQAELLEQSKPTQTLKSTNNQEYQKKQVASHKLTYDVLAFKYEMDKVIKNSSAKLSKDEKIELYDEVIKNHIKDGKFLNKLAKLVISNKLEEVIKQREDNTKYIKTLTETKVREADQNKPVDKLQKQLLVKDGHLSQKHADLIKNEKQLAGVLLLKKEMDATKWSLTAPNRKRLNAIYGEVIEKALKNPENFDIDAAKQQVRRFVNLDIDKHVLSKVQKSIDPKQKIRKAIFGLEQKDVNELIDNFRNAKSDSELLKAAKDIAKYTKYFNNENKHFAALAEKIITKNEINTKPVITYMAEGVPNKAAATVELEQFMENLKQGKVKSLTADITHISLCNTPNNIGINFINGDKQESAYQRAEKGVRDFLGKTNQAVSGLNKNTPKQLEALQGVIFEKYPLTSHLINPSDQSKYPDHIVLMQYGSHFMEKDPQFAQRWQDHNALKVEFTSKLKEFVEGGMQNPEAFEKYMQETSRKVAEMYKKDVAVMPDTANQKYGGKSKAEALQKVDSHIQGINSEDKHLSAALEKVKAPVAKTKVEVELQRRASANIEGSVTRT